MEESPFYRTLHDAVLYFMCLIYLLPYRYDSHNVT